MPVPVPALLLVTLLLDRPHALHAQSASACDLVPARRGDEIEVRPGDGAEGVARNAPIIARYTRGTELEALLRSVERDGDEDCRGLIICLFAERAGRGGARPSRVLVPGGLIAIDQRTLRFTPDEQLAAGTRHFALIARPGFDGASRTELEFVTGTAVDREPPELDDSADSLELDVEPPPPACNAPAGSLRVRLGVPSVPDDGDEESVELRLYVTRAAGVREPQLRVRAPNVAEGTVAMAFTLDPVEAASEVCIALQAVDGTDKRAEGEPALCFNPSAARRTQFVGLCSAGPGPGALRTSADNGRGLLIASAFVAAALGLRKTRGPRPRQQATRS
jgi:hypothetical protein